MKGKKRVIKIMKNKFKKGIGVLIIGIGIGVAVISGGSEDTLTISEWQTLSAMYNYEIQQLGGKITVKNIDNQSELIKALNKKIKEREVKVSEEKVIGIEASRYQEIRNEFIDKVSKSKL